MSFLRSPDFSRYEHRSRSPAALVSALSDATPTERVILRVIHFVRVFRELRETSGISGWNWTMSEKRRLRCLADDLTFRCVSVESVL